MSDEYYDAYYEVWRSGRDPDRLDRDRADDLAADGCNGEEIADDHFARMRRIEEREGRQAEYEQRVDEEYDDLYGDTP